MPRTTTETAPRRRVDPPIDTVTFTDRVLANPTGIHIPKPSAWPILFDDVPAAILINEREPLRIETLGGIGRDAVTISLVVHADDVEWPESGHEYGARWSVGGRAVLTPAAAPWHATERSAIGDDGETYALDNLTGLPAADASDDWVRVTFCAHPLFVRTEEPRRDLRA